MEFVEVNQDEMPDDTWDSYESSFDFNDDLDAQQANTESAATSTTKNLASTSRHGISDDVTFEPNKFNDADDEQNSAYGSNDYEPKQLLFRGGFFRFLKRDGVTVQAECLNCKKGNVYNGHTASNSNFLKHLNVNIES